MWQRIKKWWLEIIVYVGVVLAIVGPWVIRPGYIFLTDLSWGPHMAPLAWFRSDWLFSWVVWLLTQVIPADVVEKVFIITALAIILWGGRIIACQYTTDRRVRVLASLFLLFNPFVYDRLLYGQVGIVLAFGLTTLMFGWLVEFFRTARFRNVIQSAVALAFALQFSVQFALLAVPLMVLAMLWGIRQYWPVPWKKWLLAAGIGVVIVVVLNGQWLWSISTGQSDALGYAAKHIQRSELVAFQTAGTTPARALANVLMMSGFWGKDQWRYADLTKIAENWGRSFYFLLPVLIGGVIAGWRNRSYRWLVVGSVVMIGGAALLALGIRLPGIREITLWLFDHWVVYRGLRETQKWVAVIVIGYAIILAIGLHHLFLHPAGERRSGLLTVLIGLIIIFQAPLLLFGFQGQARATLYPADWYTADALITPADGCRGKTLVLPWHLYMSFDFIGTVTRNPAQYFFHCPVIVGSNMELTQVTGYETQPESQQVLPWLTSQGADASMLMASSVNYVVLLKELDWTQYAWLEEQPYLEQISDLPMVRVYRVNLLSE